MAGTYVNPEPLFGESTLVPFTPAAHVNNDIFLLPRLAELPPKWLLAPEFSQKRGLVVEARGTFGKWHGGDFEGKQGVVLSVFDTHNDAFESTARVRFFQPVDPLTPILPVPVQYLWPVHPEQAGERVVILAGSNKGAEANIEAVESASSMVITTMETFHVMDTSHDRLIRIMDIDEVGNKRV